MVNLNLYLGCNGNADKDGFTFCNSCNNLLLDLNKLEDGKREKVIHFLDTAANLFSGPIENYNKAFNVINFLHRDFGILNLERVVKVQKFFHIHKECGIFLIIIPEKK